MKRRYLILVTAVLFVSLIGIGTGWTVAWLTSETKSARNVFTVGSVQIQLSETWNTDTDGDGAPDSWKGILVPGTVLNKNPMVTVPQDCEDSWIFVQLQESEWPWESPQDSKISYALEEGWNYLPNHKNICFREIDREDSARTFHVLREDRIVVAENLTKQELASVGQPKLTITAYAIQRAGFDSPEDAWMQIDPTA